MGKNYGFVGPMHIRELNNGDLQIALAEKDRREFQQYAEDDEYSWYEINEMIEEHFYTDEGDFDFHSTSPIGLTSSPLIAFTKHFEGVNEYEELDSFYWDSTIDWENTKVWWYPNYQVVAWQEVLINQGEVIFTFAPNE